MGIFDWLRRPAPPSTKPRVRDGTRAIDAPLALRCGELPVGTRVRFEEGVPVAAWLDAPMRLPEVELAAGTKIELDGAPVPALVAAQLETATDVGGLRLPARTELELDDGGRVTGAVLGAALVGERGPAGLTWDRGAYLQRVDGAWALDPHGG